MLLLFLIASALAQTTTTCPPGVLTLAPCSFTPTTAQPSNVYFQLVGTSNVTCAFDSRSNTVCRRVVDGCQAGQFVMDSTICKPPAGANLPPCASTVCPTGQRCFNVPPTATSQTATAVCTDACKACTSVQNCSLSYAIGVITATCASCTPPPCAAPPSGCRYDGANCNSCGTLVCGCNPPCGLLETCNVTRVSTAVSTISGTCVCVPGTVRSGCPGIDITNTQIPLETCSSTGVGFTQTRSGTCPTVCPALACVAPSGCQLVRNAVPLAAGQCPTCDLHYAPVCPPNACNTTCNSATQMCVAPPNTLLSTGSSLTTPVCRTYCVPGTVVTSGCVIRTCNQAGTGFTETQGANCCNPTAAPVSALCGNTCQCTASGNYTCTQNPCQCTAGATKNDGCNVCTCNAGAWSCTNNVCPPNQCVEASGTTLNVGDLLPSVDGCFNRTCVIIDPNNPVATHTIVFTPNTCRAINATFGVRCFRIEFPSFQAIDIQSFLANIGSNLLAGTNVHIEVIRAGRSIVYVCVRKPPGTVRAFSDATTAPQADTVSVVADRAATGNAASLVASLGFLAAVLLAFFF